MSFLTQNRSYTINNQRPKKVQINEKEKLQLIELLFNHDPMIIDCYYCKQRITTNTRPKTSVLSLLSSFSLNSVCCIFGCCFIPFIFSEFKDTAHTCSNPECNKQLIICKRI